MNSIIKKCFDKLLVRLLTLIGFSSSFTFMACYAPPPEDLDYLEINPASLHFLEEGGTATVNVQSENRWSVFGMPHWMYVTPMEGYQNGNILITISPNESSSARSSILTITNNHNSSSSLLVRQEGCSFSVEPDSILLSGNQGSMKSFYITCRNSWQIANVPSFVEISPFIGTGNSEIWVKTVSENTDSISRKGLVRISTAYNRSVNITVIQQSKD